MKKGRGVGSARCGGLAMKCKLCGGPRSRYSAAYCRKCYESGRTNQTAQFYESVLLEADGLAPPDTVEHDLAIAAILNWECEKRYVRSLR